MTDRTIPTPTADTVVMLLPLEAAKALSFILQTVDDQGSPSLRREKAQLHAYVELCIAQSEERMVEDLRAEMDPDTWVMPERTTPTGNVLSLVRPFDPTDQDPT